jgi:hypothetical protein|tara:strand:- start:5637 stop:7025 length:1389 start_codon:yes stop_codon:yes gene_type:complete
MLTRCTPVLTLLLLVAPATILAAQGEVDANLQTLHRIASAVSATRLETDIGKLVSFGTRHTLSETESNVRGIGAARRWIRSEFEKISMACGGCLSIQYQREVIQGERRIPEPTEVVNVVAIQRGTRQPNRYVVMSADIDSRVSDPMNFRSESPGANDNASGMAGVLEAARVLSKYSFSGSIAYAALSGEEQGLFGGRIMAGIAKRDGWFVEAVLNNDMIGNIAGINNIVDNSSARVFSEGTRVVETEEEARIRRFSGGEVDSPSRNLARYVDVMADRYIPNLDVMMIYRLDRFGRGGHHRPFNEAGYPGVRIMETNEHYHRQHQDIRVEEGIQYGDVLDGVDFDYAAKLTALNAVTLASLAWAPGPPVGVTIEGAVSPHTTLKWRKAKGASGYRVYWRLTTSPVWSTSREVGDVAEYTLKNVIIDNYFFGVAAVSATGFESPVVFPGPTGSFHISDGADAND